MSWAASAIALGAGVGSSILGNKHAKKMAKKQAALARKQAANLRARAAETSLAAKREIETMRTLRSLDLPAFRQASESAMLQAQKGAERMQRQRMMGRLAPDVRQAIFGGQFQQYVGREMQRLGQYAGLTQQILQASERQQQMAMQAETQATNIEMGGQMQALQTEAAAGDVTANILGAVGQAAAQYASAKTAKADAAAESKASLKEQFALQAASKEGVNMPFIVNGTVDDAAFNKWYETSFPTKEPSSFWDKWLQ